jgi:hypothetical protein
MVVFLDCKGRENWDSWVGDFVLFVGWIVYIGEENLIRI